ncbi:MAG: M28 family peptidase [Tannerella sp.]|jgi:hypothetical protein|nr:M28 family peptidase [Tannerella sp.]
MIKFYPLLLALALASCAHKGAGRAAETAAAGETVAAVHVPDFQADSAYRFVDEQVAFGPRVPNTPAHKACGDFLAATLKRFGAQVYVQQMTLTAYNGTKLDCRNIIGSYKPAARKRVLLFAHWDSRPYADNDSDPKEQRKPIDGADDGASGVGVLLEMARLMDKQAPDVGVDILFTDAEDYGVPSFSSQRDDDNSWCLGTQFWARNPHTPNYHAQYGILLDMVGAKNATFYKEYTSQAQAPSLVEKIWDTARNLGYGNFFIDADGGSIVDDHLYVISGRGIPCVDIINYAPDNKRGFADYWHTHADNMQIISRETLKAVGQTLLNVIYKER